jgi:AraC-like DNA-binding protein
MPIYMDRHDVSETVTAELVAQLHQQDLAIQDRFGCRGLTYWFDSLRRTAFCLIEAPNEQAIREMHDYAHGKVPHLVIEVDTGIVESFLGRIGDPAKAQNVTLNIINDPAFRAVMVIGCHGRSVAKETRWTDALQQVTTSVAAAVEKFNGSIVKQSRDYFLVSFKSVSNAVDAAITLRKQSISGKRDPITSGKPNPITSGKPNPITSGKRKHDKPDVLLKIGLSTGVPVTEKNLIFEEAIRLAERMTMAAKEDLVVSAEVKALYDSENRIGLAEKEGVYCLTPADEEFITRLMDHAEKSWSDVDLKVDDLNKAVGYSKPQLYRKMIQLTGKSPITFIRDFRLNTALGLLNKGAGNVSQIAYETGFSSPSYFAKCFQKQYGLSPTEFLSVKKG